MDSAPRAALVTLVVAWLLLSACAGGPDGRRDPVASGVAPAPPPAADGLASLPVAPTAGARDDAGILRFEILDEATGAAIPGRLTFEAADGGPAGTLFPNAAADPKKLAVREDIVATLDGRGAITVPPGRYTVHATRGLEWSRATTPVTIPPRGEARLTARLRHEVDTTGWISGDFHLHTLTFSGHGDANLEERILALVAEGVEFAVATDHNHHTDFGPTIDAVGASPRLTAVTGNEVSVPIGHLNAFPLEPDGPIPDPDARDARELFRFIRAQPNRYGVVPVIQINHPRWNGIDYFAKVGLDPVTSEPAAEFYSGDFDTLEVFNENAGWGYYDAEAPDAPPTGDTRHSVLRDWFGLLNRGHRYAAVGNSDSHHVRLIHAGYPRNFVRSSIDDSGALDPAQIVESIRNRRLFTTLGPFVEFEAGGSAMGGDGAARDGRLDLHIRVQAASWIDCDRVKIVVNGDVIREIAVPQTREPVRLDTRLTLPVDADGWVALLVEGDDPLAPIVQDRRRPVRPLAVVNPVWFDGDGDGRWTAPAEQAAQAVAHESAEALDRRFAALAGRPASRALLVLAAADRGDGAAVRLARLAIDAPDRLVRLAGARAAERLADPALAPALAEALARAAGDPYVEVALLRAIAAAAGGEAPFSRSVVPFLARTDPARLARYRDEIESLLPGSPVDAWRVVGFFPNPSRETLVAEAFGPEGEGGGAGEFRGKDGEPVAWREADCDARGFLDLRRTAGPPDRAENAIAYAETFLRAPSDREALFALGSDDGCRVWVNGELLLEDRGRHAVSPFAHVGRMPLRAGWNRVLVKVENGTGSFGLIFRVFDEEVRAAREPK